MHGCFLHNRYTEFSGSRHRRFSGSFFCRLLTVHLITLYRSSLLPAITAVAYPARDAPIACVECGVRQIMFRYRTRSIQKSQCEDCANPHEPWPRVSKFSLLPDTRKSSVHS